MWWARLTACPMLGLSPMPSASDLKSLPSFPAPHLDGEAASHPFGDLSMRSLTFWLGLTLVAVTVAAAAPAQAYIGPGAGITMLGALWGVVVAVALAIGAVLFWPIRLLMRKFRKPAVPPATGVASDKVS